MYFNHGLGEVAFAYTGIPLFASMIPLMSTDEPSAFALDSQLLNAMALGFTRHSAKLAPTVLKSEFTEFTKEKLWFYQTQAWTRTAIMAVTWIELFVSLALHFKHKLEYKFNASWVLGGIIGSFVLSENFISNLLDSTDTDLTPGLYMFCAYLDVVAWIPQYKLTLEKAHVDRRALTYIVCMFTHDILTIAGLSYQYHLSQLYDPIGFNTIVLKFILFCGFIVKYLIKHWRALISTQAEPRASHTNNIIEVLYSNSEPTVHYSAGNIKDNQIYPTPGVINISVDKNKLMLPT